MKIKRDKNGVLEIERGGRFEPQTCPFDQLKPPNYCGDWCPLFGEPEPYMVTVNPNIWPSMEERRGDMLRICQGRVLVGEIIDERKEPGK